MEIKKPNESAWHRQSLAVLPNYLGKSLYLLLLPTLRGLIYALESDFESWLRSAWVDLATLAVILLPALLRWRYSMYRPANDGLRFRRGFLCQTETLIPRGQVVSVEEERSWWVRLFGAVRLTVRSRGASVLLYVNTRRSATLRELLGCGRKENMRIYRPGTAHLGLYALLTSNSPGGVIFTGVLISRFGSILGREVRDKFVGALTRLLHLVAYGVPGAMFTAALVLLGAWAVSFARTVLENAATELRYTADRVMLTSGSIVRRRRTVMTGCISAVELRQTLPGILLGLGTAYIDAPGLVTERDRILMLSASAASLDKTLALLLPNLCPVDPTLRPLKNGWLPYLWAPAAALCVLLPLPFVLSPLFPFWQPMLRLVCWMSCVPAAWLLAAAILGFRRTCAGVSDGRLTVTWPSLGSLRRMTVPLRDLRMVEIRRLFPHGRGCRLIFRVGQDRLRRISMGGMPYADCLRFVGELEKNSCPAKTKRKS